MAIRCFPFAADATAWRDRMRALEARRPLVRAANDGVSAVIGSRGEIVTRAPAGEARNTRSPRVTGSAAAARATRTPPTMLSARPK